MNHNMFLIYPIFFYFRIAVGPYYKDGHTRRNPHEDHSVGTIIVAI